MGSMGTWHRLKTPALYATSLCPVMGPYLGIQLSSATRFLRKLFNIREGFVLKVSEGSSTSLCSD